MLMGIKKFEFTNADWVDVGYIDEVGSIYDEINTWENKTIRLTANGYPVGWIKENFPRPKRRNRTW